MDSIDAQCLVVALFDGKGVTPPLWRHGRDGSLHYRFPGSPRSYSWPAGVVADMAGDWRAREDADTPPAAIARHVAAHVRVAALLDEGGLEPPDAVVHDLDAAEVHLVWEERKLVVIVDLDDPGEFALPVIPDAA